MKPFWILLTLVGCLLLPPAAGAAPILFDLGHSENQTSGNWNNVTHDTSGDTGTGVRVTDAIDANGDPTLVDFNITVGFTLGMNRDALDTDGVYPGSAGRDSFVMRSSPAQVQLEDLDPNSLYDVRLFSNTDAPSRNIQWTINGVSMVSANAFNNTTEVTQFSGVSPDGAGNLVIDAVASGSHGYWNVLDIEDASSGPRDEATVFTWNADGVGDWADESNWIFDVGFSAPAMRANSPNHTAIFSGAATGPTAAVTHAAVTVNRIEFNNTNHSYFVSGGGSVNLAATTDPISPLNPSMSVQGSHEFQVRVNLQNDATVDVSSEGMLTFNNTLDLAGRTLTTTGAGTIAIRNDLTLGGGTLDVQQGTIAGNGTVGGDVFNDGGTISPGNSAGVLTVEGGVPEPGTMALLVLGGLLLGWTWAWRRRAG